MTAVWAGIDSGKRAHHCVVIDSTGRLLLSRRVVNDVAALLELIAAVLAVAGGDPAVWATDLNSGGAALLIALLAERGQQLLYIPGRIVHHVAATYRGDGKTDSNDVTTLSNSLASLSSDGQTVTLYSTASETFTTVDTSTGTVVSTPGSETDDVAYMFNATATNPAITGYADQNSYVEPLTEATPDTATATATSSTTPTTSPAAVITDPTTGLPVATSYGTRTPIPEQYIAPNYNGTVTWADNNAQHGGYNGFNNDSTVFISRALLYGGHLDMVMYEKTVKVSILNHVNYNDWGWYDGVVHNLLPGCSQSYWTALWSFAEGNTEWQYLNGAYFLHYTSWAVKGDIIWVDWTGSTFYNAKISQAAAFRTEVSSRRSLARMCTSTRTPTLDTGFR
ncbi:MAG TPA: transposase [Jatrophihabitantaceae bacterium]|jgi:hypothetical protein|nr:transposase [Jatrophihabitantaceae bacterium]